MINSRNRDCDIDLWQEKAVTADAVLSGDRFAVARAITGAELGPLGEDVLVRLREAPAARTTPVLGITGTGGSGKSSLTDVLVCPFRGDQHDQLRIAGHAGAPPRRPG